MPDRFVVALDCGSTNWKAGLFSPSLDLLATAAIPVSYTHYGPIHYDFPAEHAWESAVAVIGEVCEQAGIDAPFVTDVALSSQAQTFCFVGADGNAVSRMVSWLDRGAVVAAEEAGTALGENFHDHCSFPTPIPQLQLCKARQMLAESPACRAASLASLPGYLAGRLGVGNVTDENLAAMGGLYSLAERGWWPDALSFAGLTPTQLPRLVPLGGVVVMPRDCRQTGLSAGTRVVFAGNDQTCGAYGNGISEHRVLVTLGTALVAYRCAGTERGPYHAAAFWGPYPGGQYYELATRDEGCLALDWVRRELFPGHSLAEFDDMALAYLSDVSDSSTLFHPDQIGVREALPGTANSAEAAYATLEGIGFSLRTLVEDGLGIPHGGSAVQIAGGGATSTVWRQIIADILGRPTLPATGDSLRGAAAMALGLAVDATDSLERCEPNPERTRQMERRYRRWLAHE
jgi:gluconokinase